MGGICDEFGGSLTADVLEFNPDAIPAPDTLHIRMTRGERRIADEIRKQFGGFKRVVIDVDGERNEFGADSLIQMLEDYEDAQGMNNHMKLFGTPERAARTVFGIVFSEAQGCDDNCPLSEFCDVHVDEEPPDDGGESALLEWLRGEGEVIDEPDTIRNELADGGLIADVLAPVCVDEKERRAFERGRVHERFAQQIFKEATS